MRVLLQAGSARELLTTKKIATTQGISQKFISTVVVPLKRAGFINVKRGAKGGITLAKSPSEISIVDVIELFQGPIAILDCLSDQLKCQQKGNCQLYNRCRVINTALLNALRKFTLAGGLAELEKMRQQNPDNPDSCLRKGVFLDKVLGQGGKPWRGC